MYCWGRRKPLGIESMLCRMLCRNWRSVGIWFHHRSVWILICERSVGSILKISIFFKKTVVFSPRKKIIFSCFSFFKFFFISVEFSTNAPPVIRLLFRVLRAPAKYFIGILRFCLFCAQATAFSLIRAGPKIDIWWVLILCFTARTLASWRFVHFVYIDHFLSKINYSFLECLAKRSFLFKFRCFVG